MSIPPVTPLGYTGDSQSVPYIVRTFDPDSGNYQFNVPTIWINKSGGKAWILLAKPDSVASWQLFTTTIGDLIDIAVPNGTTPVVPTSAGTISFTEGTGVTITGGTNTIEFAASGGGLDWKAVTGTSGDLAISNGYVTQNVALTTLTLPTTAAFGDVIAVSGVGAGGWKIAQNASQYIIFGSLTSTTGTGGYIASTLSTNTVFLLCVVADVGFKVIQSMGNLTVN